jgi:4-hydroxyproline epimerase
MPSRHTFSCIDAHTCGNPVRVVSGGVPFLKGNNMLEKRQYFLENLDWIRTGLMFEPRGHDMMSGSMLFPPHDPENDFAVLFIETSGCLPMCGHGTIGTITIAIEEGLIHPKTPGFLRMEAPAGLVLVEYTQVGKKVTSVKLTNVKSFLAAESLEIESEELGKLTVDVAYGGNFYCIVDPQENFPGIEHFKAEQLISMARNLRQKMNERYDFVTPSRNAFEDCRMCYGPEKQSIQVARLEMQYFMATRPLTAPHAARELPLEWHSGLPRAGSSLEMNLSTKALSAPNLLGESRK